MSQKKNGSGRAPLPPINFEALARALLDQAEQLVPQWLRDGVQRGHEWVCGSLAGEAGGSCSVNLTNGKWKDFQSGEAGNDLISLYAGINDLTMGKAAVQVARELGLESVAGVQPGSSSEPAKPRPAPPPPKPKPAADEGWRTVTPVSDTAPAVTYKHQFRAEADIEHVAEYRTEAGLYGYVVRFRTSGGGKDTIARTWCTSAKDGASKWHWKQWDEPRPLYLPGHALPGDRTVVLVEGEKKAGILQDLLEAGAPGVYCVASWPGGSNAWQKADWSWLQDCTVLAWPDCDSKREALTAAERKATPDAAAQEVIKQSKPLLPAHKQPGLKAMLGIGARLRDAHACTVQLLPILEPGAVVDGWDCADAITTDGWDFARVQAFFGQAQPLPPTLGVDEPTGPSGGGGGGKKNNDPATAEETSGEDGSRMIRGKLIPRWLLPYWDGEKNRWLTSRKLVIAALEHDPQLCTVLGLNELSNNIDARQAWPWLHGRAGPITGSVDLLLGDYLTRTYGLPSIARAALIEAMETVAHARPFHPVRLYFQGLHWDDTTRIDKWLIYVLGETPQSLSPALCEYLTQIGRFWLLGMVNRVMEPGCKFDYCPVLEGPGGLRKSTMVEVLCGSAWFSDAHFDLTRGKEGQEQVQGLLLYELAELAGLGKAEIQLIKAFISSKVDRYRPSYGRTVESFPRQCVLVGTTNENTYLRDRTGNRRFWPIPVRHCINTTWLAKWRDQLFAEAYQLYLQGTRFVPTPEDELRLFVPMQESRMVETAVLSEMTHVLTRAPAGTGIGAIVNELTQFVTISQLALALGVDAAKSSPALEAQIRSWLDHEGWQRVKKQINGVRAWGYERPKDWPPRELDEPFDAGTPGAAGELIQGEGDDDAPF